MNDSVDRNREDGRGTWLKAAKALILEIGGELGAASIIAIASLVGGALTAIGLWQKAQEHWLAIVVGLLLVLGNAVFVGFMLRKSRHANDEILHLKKELSHFQSIVESCGITQFWPATENLQAWKNCVGKITSRDELLIADCTGTETHNGAELGNLLKGHEGNIKVLFIKQDSDAFKRRVSDVAGSDPHARALLAAQYRVEIDRALCFFMKLCDSTKELRRSVEIRACSRTALWKLLIFGDSLCLQHYEVKKADNASPVYAFTRDTGTMPPSFENIFFYRWELSKNEVLLKHDENGRHEWPDLTCD